MAGAPTFLDFKVVEVWRRLNRIPASGEAVCPFQEGDRSPATLEALWRIMLYAWLCTAPAFGLAWLGVSLLLQTLHLAGRELGVRVLVFGLAFAIAGGVDAYWRYLLAWEASRRDERENAASDSSARLTKLVQLNDGRIVIQLAAGIAFAWIVN